MEFVSKGIERLTGYPPSAFTERITLTFADLIHPKDRAEIANRIASAMADRGSFRATYRICTRSGNLKWVEEQGAAVLDDRGEVWAREGFICDITSVKNAEALVREQAALLDHARDAIYVMNMDGRFIYWNKGAERLYKWTSSEGIGQTYRDLFGGVFC